MPGGSWKLSYGPSYSDPTCGYCNDRYDRCHTTCQKYVAWKSEREETARKVWSQRKTENDLYQVFSSRNTRGRNKAWKRKEKG